MEIDKLAKFSQTCFVGSKIGQGIYTHPHSAHHSLLSNSQLIFIMLQAWPMQAFEFTSWIYPVVCLFESTRFIRATRVLRFIIECVSWFENDTENIDDKVSSMLHNIYCIKTFLRKSKVRIRQYINVNDSYPVITKNGVR